MNLHGSITRVFSSVNEEQRAIAESLDGPLLVIAGPGSGKTFSLVLRTLNILANGLAIPSEIVVCTFTEKAAMELKDRIHASAAKIGLKADLGTLRVGTIHGLCHRLVNQYRHHTQLGNGFHVLDELTQGLFLYEHFEEIFGADATSPYLGKWASKWRAIEGIIPFLNKITEECLDPQQLAFAERDFLRGLGTSYSLYRKAQQDHNRIDFAVLQRVALDLLALPEIGPRIRAQVRFVMVDEYQDTNAIQERIVLNLASGTRNCCVVGDEDQSLYRFRGATVRNILEFPNHFPGCTRIQLTTNYRSHQRIVAAYDRWMATADWSGPGGTTFRYGKTIRPDPDTEHPQYPAVFSIWTQSEAEEGRRFASLVSKLKQDGVVDDYSQIALLLHSVQLTHSGPYLKALRADCIPAYCPRARAFFQGEEIRWVISALALVHGWHGEGRGELSGQSLADLAAYVDQGLVELAQAAAQHPELPRQLQCWVAEIEGLQPGESLDIRLQDYLYRLLALEPFLGLLADENRARNLALFSQLLNTFQQYYHHNIVTHANRIWLRRNLFNSFLRMLLDNGLNEIEDADQPFPKGHVQVLTIHQSKGLEFPVVVVGSLDANIRTAKQVDEALGAFYARPAFEPASRITEFDRMRLHYVAFSRAAKLLVLTCSGVPKDHFASIWEGLPQWPHVRKDLLSAQRFDARARHPVKKRYSFTGDLRVYQTCPRQYQFYRYYDFTPSRSASIFFGLLVHQAIEEIHRVAIDGRADTLDDARVRELFDSTHRFLLLSDVRPIGPAAQEDALHQVLNYFHQNKDFLRRVRETEVDVSVEKDGYILTGKVDLLMGDDGRLELLDFKTSERPDAGDPILRVYEQQLCTYAHILEQRHGKRPDRLLLYWTAELTRAAALMEFAYNPALVASAGAEFDRLVARIQARDFAVVRVPSRPVCKECDLKGICAAQGLIRPFPSAAKRLTQQVNKN